MLPRQPTLNDKLRAKRLAAGMTESQLAEAIVRLISARTGHRAAVDGNYVSKLERGRITWPNAVYRSALREIFDAASDAELGFYAARTRRDAQHWLPASGGRASEAGSGPSPPLARQPTGSLDVVTGNPRSNASEQAGANSRV
jgi:hypothetical protein